MANRGPNVDKKANDSQLAKKKWKKTWPKREQTAVEPGLGKLGGAQFCPFFSQAILLPKEHCVSATNPPGKQDKLKPILAKKGRQWGNLIFQCPQLKTCKGYLLGRLEIYLLQALDQHSGH